MRDPLASKMSDSSAIPSRVVMNDPNLELVWRVMNRSVEIEALEELYQGLVEPERYRSLDSNSGCIAFGFDTNAIYRVGLNGTRGANAVDYLRWRHKGPVIVPGQAVQEIWNNILSGVEPQAKRLRKNFESLQKEVEGIGQNLGVVGEKAGQVLEELIQIHGEWIDPASLDVFKGTLEAFRAVAKTSFVPRKEFYSLARVRKETKTPPGFQDPSNNYGDFFIWADFLYGLAQVGRDGISAVVLVTNDKKSDWSRNRIAHPLLVAEAVAVAGVKFRLWTVDDFQDHVNRLLS